MSDYALDPQDGRRDHIALFVVTAGEGIIQHSEEAKARGEYFKAHALQALGIETAEACAEWLHRRIREDWGFPDSPTMTMHERFTSRYRGKRYSFGYPACPNLEDQTKLWRLSAPRRYRRATYRRLHDGARSERLRDRVPSSRLRLLQRRRRNRAGIRVDYPNLVTRVGKSGKLKAFYYLGIDGANPAEHRTTFVKEI